MKRILYVVLAILFSFVALAQEEAERAPMENEAWSNETKIALLIGFAVICLWFTARTFRDKPSA